MDHTFDNPDRPFTLRPLGEKVVVKWIDQPKKIGNIILPDTAKSIKYRAILIEIGPDAKKLADVALGSEVMTQLYTAEVGLGEYTVMDQGSILAVVQYTDGPKKEKK